MKKEFKANQLTGEALQYWLKAKNFKQVELAEKIGVEQGTISNMARGARGIKAELLEKICDAFGISIPDFFAKDSFDSPETVFIELVKARPRAGSGGLEVDGAKKNLYSFHKSFIERKGGTPESMKLFTIDGTSMEPTLKSGDMVMINQRSRDIVAGHIYLLRFEGDLMIKRLLKKPGGTIVISSDNEEFNPPIDIGPNDEGIDLEVFGRMVWSCREY